MDTYDRNIFIVIGLTILIGVTLIVVSVRRRSHEPAVSTETITETAESTPTAVPTASPTTAGPLVYVVQQGDTLIAIAQAHDVSTEDLIAANDLEDPDVLHIGQKLIIPREGRPRSTAAPPDESSAVPASTTTLYPTALSTLTPSGPLLVEISQASGAGDVEAETVIVRNRGGTVSLEGWTLSNAAGDEFVFPALTLFADAQVRVHSATGEATPSDLYWGREEPAWREGGLITLRDAAGDVMDTYIVQEP